MSKSHKPVIGIICDAFGRDGNADRQFHGVAEEYIRAINEGTRCTPLLIPVSTNGDCDADALCQILDGLLLTGSRTNVHPDRYAGAPSKPDTLFDLKRDITAFALVQAAIKNKLPVLGICRGFQEINVALGGTLHQELTELGDRLDHAKHMALPQEQQYQTSHNINLTVNGFLHQLLGISHIEINSLHHQGVDQLAETLVLEAIATDGTPEAFKLPNDDHFFVATQWHPEWHIASDPVSQALFHAFDLAVHEYAGLKHPRTG